jgi:hypothetical protein
MELKTHETNPAKAKQEPILPAVELADRGKELVLHFQELVLRRAEPLVFEEE